MYFLVARLLLSVSLSPDFCFFRFREKGRRGEIGEREIVYIFFWLLDLSILLFCFGAKNFFFYTYRLLIDEVENNVKILKLISELSERYKISDEE